MKKTGFLMLCFVLAGCANKSQTAHQSLVTPLPTPAPAPQEQVVTTKKTNALMGNETCIKSLSALQTYNARSWNQYSSEMRELTGKTSQFLSVKADLNPDINDLVMSVYESRMKTLCYKIESTLGQSMIEQASHL
ncbi:MAG TPA: hypothetical protein VH187_18630 [Scandinavium sp.]|uniref:hypothetical protein n=1 Tax=Scandinavium sp. TaxID=2830653 RepID=UPI002E34CF62|nr:hypothetical protein [Scandinavium sp.]HEX4503154.1 hypothetical protein [Scandinavium sp.]